MTRTKWPWPRSGVGRQAAQAQLGRCAGVQDHIAVLYAGDEAEKQTLLLGEPERFSTTADST